MKVRISLAVFCLAGVVMAFGQQTLNDDSVDKMVKAGLDESTIITMIQSQPGKYDLSPEALVSLKKDGVSDKILGAMAKASAPQQQPTPTVQEPNPSSGAAIASVTQPQPAPGPPGKPRVFLQSASKGTNWMAARDQTMEMGKDLGGDCPDVQITLAQQNADYTILLNHIEMGLMRDNQFQIADRNGDLISRTKEGGSIRNGMKKACAAILADWNKQTTAAK